MSETEKLDLDAIERRANAATAGPWYQGDTDEHDSGDADLVYGLDDNWIVEPVHDEKDAAFIAHSRKDIPALVAEVRRLSVQRDALLAACEAWVDYFDALVNDADPADALTKMYCAAHGKRIEQTRAAIAAAKDQGETHSQAAWLVERGPAVGHSPTVWWCGGDERASVGEDEMKNWTYDALKARRFSTREEADAFGQRLFGRSLFTAAEHVFIG